MMSPRLFNILMDGCMKEIKANVGNVGARLKINGIRWAVVACLFADDTVVCRVKHFSGRRIVCKRRKLKVNAEKSKVMVFERREVEEVDFNTHSRVSVPAVE